MMLWFITLNQMSTRCVINNSITIKDLSDITKEVLDLLFTNSTCSVSKENMYLVYISNHAYQLKVWSPLKLVFSITEFRDYKTNK